MLMHTPRTYQLEVYDPCACGECDEAFAARLLINGIVAVAVGGATRLSALRRLRRVVEHGIGEASNGLKMLDDAIIGEVQ